MKQIQLIFQDADTFRKKIAAVRDKYPECTAMMQFFYDKTRQKETEQAIAILKKEYPQAHYFGCASNANIENGMIAEGSILVVCNIFESDDVQIEIFQYVLTDETQKDVCDDFLAKVAERPWVKGIELLITIRDMSTTYFCDRLSEMDEKIQIFGGSSFNKNLDRNDVGVFSEKGDFLDAGVVFVLIGGEKLHIWTSYITGWKPLGQKMLITRAEANRLYELGGEPAYDTYYRYLQIDNDEFFYHNTLEFPIFYERNGINILRVPSRCMDDGSLIMTSDMATGSMAQISYGDPQTILKSVFHEAERLSDFVPDGILIFDCASRRSFWGSEDINRESLPFQTIADTAGFYTAGEFHRMGKSLNQHNVTMVIVGLREDEAGDSNKSKLLKKYHYNNEHVSMVRRLANFIDVASRELDETNRKLEAVNQKLMKMAVTDELTGIFNRREIQHRITEAAGKQEQFSLIMMDLDNFKKVNDTFGHDEGDNVLKGFSSVLKSVTEQAASEVSVGRWGGEEFMIIVKAGIQEAAALSESIRKNFSEMQFPVSGVHTVSCGVAVAHEKESADSVCIRADHVLYLAKHQGRNCTRTEEQIPE